MKILVIGSQNSGAKNDPNVLAGSLADAGHRAEVVFWEDLAFTIQTSDVQLRFGGVDPFAEKPDLVIAVGWYKSGRSSIYRDVAYSVALYLTHRGIAFWNGEMAQQRSTTKLSCMVQLALEGISVPTTHFSLKTANVLDSFELPVVAKAAAASRGRSNFLIETEEDIKDLLVEDAHYLVQPFLVNDHDLRVICFGSRPALVLRRARAKDADTHLNNTSQGGTAEWLPIDTIDEQLLTISEKICRIMKRDMAGIDFIPDKSSPFGYSCLEVNAIPQLTSGHDTDMKLKAFVSAVAQIEKENG